MSVYHENFVASMEDDTFVPKLYTVVITLASLCTILEFTLLSDVSKMFTFNILQDNPDNWNVVELEKTAIVGIVILFVIGIASQLRIEFDTWSHGDLDSGFAVRLKNWIVQSDQVVHPQGLDHLEHHSHHVSAIRVASVLGAVWVVVGLTLPFLEFANQEALLMAGSFLNQAAMPFAFVWTHDHIKEHLRLKLKWFKIFFTF